MSKVLSFVGWSVAALVFLVLCARAPEAAILILLVLTLLADA